MLKRTLVVLSLTMAIVFASEPLQAVHGIIMTDAEWLAMDRTDAAAASDQKSEGRGNAFVRALKAPFKAIGRLFGRKKKDDNQLSRISEKDAKRFESVPGVQRNETKPAPEVSSAGPATESSGTPNAVVNTGDLSSEAALAMSAQVHLEKGRELMNSRDWNAAIGELSLAASANPKSSEASSLLGVAYCRKGLRDLARRSFENAVRIKKDDPQNLNNLGFLLYEDGDYEKASKYLERAAKLAPNDALIWNNLGLAQAERGHFDDAYQSFAHAQGELKGHLNVATRLQHHGSTKKAIKHLEQALALQPKSPEVLARLIELYDRTGNERQAQEARTSLEALRTLAQTPVK